MTVKNSSSFHSIYFITLPSITDILFNLRYLKIWYLLIPFFFVTACNRNRIPEGEVTASVIDYKVTYLTEKAGKIPTKMLPGKMTVIFAGHYALNRIEGFFGQFSLIYIGNLKNESVITMLKLFDKKYVYYGKKGELPCGFVNPGKLSITETGKKMELLGLSCKELLISSEEDSTFYALTTNDLKIKNPNITTPYRDIKEVLLEFRTQLSLLQMQLTASNVKRVDVSWDLFKVSDEYQERPKEFIDNTIQELFK